jgi:HK97 gp10 family phage protein
MITGQTKKTVNRYREIQQKIEAAARKRNLQKAEDIAEEAKRFAPVKTGELRDSIHVESNTRTGDARVVVGAAHGLPVELGHHRGGVYIPPQPYMSPAVEIVKQEYRSKPLKIK